MLRKPAFEEVDRLVNFQVKYRKVKRRLPWQPRNLTLVGGWKKLG